MCLVGVKERIGTVLRVRSPQYLNSFTGTALYQRIISSSLVSPEYLSLCLRKDTFAVGFSFNIRN